MKVLLASILTFFTVLTAFAQEPRQPNFSKRLQAVEGQLGTSSELGYLTAGCALENDSTPIPDACVGDGTDGGGGVDTANSPNANEFARFTDADTIEGRTAAEAKADLDLEIGTDLAASNLDFLVGTATAGLSAEIAVGTSPGGELGGTWASPTLDDSLTVDAWAVTNATGTTAAANDNDTSLATTAFVQQEIDDGDLLSDNCVLENDSTPIPDSCVGDGSDAGGGGGGISYAEAVAAVLAGF